MTRPFRPVLAVLAVGLLAACTPANEVSVEPTETATDEVRYIQPGAPGEPSRVLTPEEVAELDLDPPEHTATDVEFMQDMIHHHTQALEMTGLVEERTEREDIPLFAERMDISQEDEIELMKRWLEARGEEVPDGHTHDELMPGMLTEEEMAELEAASGEEFDRLFLERMRQHHLGALEMVERLFAADAGQEPEIFQFASHIDSDQRIELSRIDMMLADIHGQGAGEGEQPEESTGD